MADYRIDLWKNFFRETTSSTTARWLFRLLRKPPADQKVSKTQNFHRRIFCHAAHLSQFRKLNILSRTEEQYVVRSATYQKQKKMSILVSSRFGKFWSARKPNFHSKYLDEPNKIPSVIFHMHLNSQFHKRLQINRLWEEDNQILRTH